MEMIIIWRFGEGRVWEGLLGLKEEEREKILL